MKILVCASEYFPRGSGIANVAYNVVREWERLGHECTVCSPTGPDIEISSLSKCGYPGLLSFWERARSYFRGRGDAHDMVWLHNPLFLGTFPFDSALVTIHTTSYGQVERKVHPWWLHAYYLSSAEVQRYSWNKMQERVKGVRFTTISDGVDQELTHLGIERHPIIPNGVDTKRFHPANRSEGMRSRWAIPPGGRVFLSVGRLSAQKKPLKLLQVFDLVQKQLGNVWLVFVGTGELMDKAVAFAKQNDIKHVLFLGRVSNEDLPIAYASADYYVMSSVYEGQPLTVLEAMASGLPCIVSDIPSIDVVRKAKSGLLTDYQDPPKCAEAILDYLSRDNYANAVNGREYVVRYLDWEIIARRYLEMAGPGGQ